MGQIGILHLGRSTLAIVLTLLVCRVANAQETPPSLAEVLKGMQNLEEKVRALPSWFVKYRQVKEVTKDIPHGWLTKYPICDCVFARQGEWTLASSQEVDTKEPQLCFVWRGDEVAADKINESILIQAEPNVGLWNIAFYTNSVFLNVRSKREYIDPHTRTIRGLTSPYKEMQFALPGSIEKRREKYRGRPKLELCGGVPCVVVEEPNVDVLWIDANHGYICVRRQIFQSTGGLLVEWRNEDLREWIPGLWLPYLQTIEAYNGRDETPPKIRGKRRMTEVHTVQDMGFSELPPAFFTVPLPQVGEPRVADYIRGFEYTLRPANMTPEECADEALLSIGIGRAPRTSWLGLRLVFVLNAIALGVVLLLYQLRRLRRAWPSKE
jgi:hypothetical protein